MLERLQPLEALDVCQGIALATLGQLRADDLDRPTPCDEWSVRDIANKMTASTLVFVDFANRRMPDPAHDLINPPELIGDDPAGVYLAAAIACREAWNAPGAMDGLAPSTVGEFPAKGVVNARIFDTTVLAWDIATACGFSHRIDDRLAAYVLHVAKALVPNVRSQSPERYKDHVAVGEAASLVEQLIATTGRDPHWSIPSAP